MPTIRLTPSTNYRSNGTYLQLTDVNNMYANTDSSTYGYVTNTRTGTTAYWFYLQGFNFSSIPNNAIVNSFSIKVKCYGSGISVSSTYRPRLANNTTLLEGTCGNISTNVGTYTFADLTDDWDTIKSYGQKFGIRLSCRRSVSNTTGYLYVYGAEILVDYTIPSPVRLKHNGSWITPTKLLVKSGGSWKEASGIKAKSGGSWQ